MASFESLGQILPRTVKQGRVADELIALQVRKAFINSLNKLFGENKLPKISPAKFSYGILTVRVPDPVWSTQLRQKEAAILEELNLFLGKKLVKGLKFGVATKY